MTKNTKYDKWYLEELLEKKTQDYLNNIKSKVTAFKDETSELEFEQ